MKDVRCSLVPDVPIIVTKNIELFTRMYYVCQPVSGGKNSLRFVKVRETGNVMVAPLFYNGYY